MTSSVSDLLPRLEEVGALSCSVRLEAGAHGSSPTLSVLGRTGVGKSTLTSITSSAGALAASDGLPHCEGMLNQLDCVRASRANDVSTLCVLRIPSDYNDNAVYRQIEQQAKCQQEYKLGTVTNVYPIFGGVGVMGVGSEVHLLHDTSTSHRVQVYLRYAQSDYFVRQFQELMALLENTRYLANRMSDFERNAHEEDINRRTAKLCAVMRGDNDPQKKQHLEAMKNHYRALPTSERNSYTLSPEALHEDLSNWLGKEILLHGTTCCGSTQGCQGCNIYAGAAGIRDILQLLTTSTENPRLLLGLRLLAEQQPDLLLEADREGSSLYDLVLPEQADDAAKSAAVELAQHLDHQEGGRRWNRLVSNTQLRMALLSAIESSTVTIYEPHSKPRPVKILDLIGTQDNSRVRQMALREARVHENHVLYVVAQDLSGAGEVKDDLLTSSCFRQLVANTIRRKAGGDEACPLSVSILINKDNSRYRGLGDVMLGGLHSAARRRQLQQLNAIAEATSRATLIRMIQEACLHNGQRLSNREAEAVAAEVHIVCGLPALGHSLVSNRHQLDWAREDSTYQVALAATNYTRFQQLLDRPLLLTAQHELHQLTAENMQQQEQLIAKGAIRVPSELLPPPVVKWLLPMVDARPLKLAAMQNLQTSAYAMYCKEYLLIASEVVKAFEATLLQELRPAVNAVIVRLVPDRIQPLLQATAEQVVSRHRWQQQLLAFVTEATGNSQSKEACNLEVEVLELLLDELCQRPQPPAAGVSGLEKIHAVLASSLPNQVVPMVTELTRSMCGELANVKGLFKVSSNQHAVAAIQALQDAVCNSAAAEPPATAAANGRATRSTGLDGGRPPLLAAALQQMTEVVQQLFGTAEMTESKCRLAWSRYAVTADIQQRMLYRDIRDAFVERWFEAVAAARPVAFDPTAHGSTEEHATQHLQAYVRRVLEELISTSPAQQKKAVSAARHLSSRLKDQLLGSSTHCLQGDIFSQEHLPRNGGKCRLEMELDPSGDRFQPAHHPVVGTVNALGTWGRSVLGVEGSGVVAVRRRAQDELQRLQTRLQHIEILAAEVDMRLGKPGLMGPAAGHLASGASSSRQDAQQQQQAEAQPLLQGQPGPQRVATDQMEQGQQQRQQLIPFAARGNHVNMEGIPSQDLGGVAEALAADDAQAARAYSANWEAGVLATAIKDSIDPLPVERRGPGPWQNEGTREAALEFASTLLAAEDLPPAFQANAPPETKQANLASYGQRLLANKQSLLLVTDPAAGHFGVTAADYAVLAVQQGWMLNPRVRPCTCVGCAAVASTHGYPPVLLLDVEPEWAKIVQRTRVDLVQHFKGLTATDNCERAAAIVRISDMYVPDAGNNNHVAAVLDLHESHVLAGKLQIHDVQELCGMLQLNYMIDIPGERSEGTGVVSVSNSPSSVRLVSLPASACRIMYDNEGVACAHQLVQMAVVFDASAAQSQQQQPAQQAQHAQPELPGPHLHTGGNLGSAQQQQQQQNLRQTQVSASGGLAAGAEVQPAQRTSQVSPSAEASGLQVSGPDYRAAAPDAGRRGTKRSAAAGSPADGARSQQQPYRNQSGSRSRGRQWDNKQRRAL